MYNVKLADSMSGSVLSYLVSLACMRYFSLRKVSAEAWAMVSPVSASC